MESVNWLLVIPLFILQLVLLVLALLDLRRISATNGPKWVWVLVVIFLNTVGPIIYFFFGRKTAK